MDSSSTARITPPSMSLMQPATPKSPDTRRESLQEIMTIPTGSRTVSPLTEPTTPPSMFPPPPALEPPRSTASQKARSTAPTATPTGTLTDSSSTAPTTPPLTRPTPLASPKSRDIRRVSLPEIISTQTGSLMASSLTEPMPPPLTSRQDKTPASSDTRLASPLAPIPMLTGCRKTTSSMAPTLLLSSILRRRQILSIPSALEEPRWAK